MVSNMTDNTILQLKKTFLFNGLPDDVLGMLSNSIIHRRLTKDEVLFHKGDAGDSLFMIGQGWVKIVTEDTLGSQLTLNQCGPGEAIGEMSLFDQAPRSAGVVALSDVALLELKQDDLLKLLDQRPDVALLVIRGISSRLRGSTTYIEKAIEWSKKMAEGDFSFTEQIQSSELLDHATQEDRARQFLSEFFKMASNVREREEKLKQQVEKLTLQIDEARRKLEFEELTSSDFYANLKEQAKRLRDQRQDKK
jgi:CRP-like cAMP-binding protein